MLDHFFPQLAIPLQQLFHEVMKQSPSEPSAEPLQR